jgi:prepilin-type N-terminal cleavage/methylation domain-containing protein
VTIRGRAAPTGFTLIEVLVALTIAGVVVIGAHQIFTGVADGANVLTAERRNLDRSSNARRWLKATFLSLEPPFEGRTARVSFASWQLSSGGWFEQQQVVLTRDGRRLVAMHGDVALELAENVTDVAFDYLLEPGADTRWVREWISPVSAPVAIRVRIAGCGMGDAGCVDTLLFLVKERG